MTNEYKPTHEDSSVKEKCENNNYKTDEFTIDYNKICIGSIISDGTSVLRVMNEWPENHAYFVGKSANGSHYVFHSDGKRIQGNEVVYHLASATEIEIFELKETLYESITELRVSSIVKDVEKLKSGIEKLLEAKFILLEDNSQLDSNFQK